MEQSIYSAGSNLGDKEETLKEAIYKIDKRKDCVVTKVSNFYTTDPVGYEDQDQFVNCVFEIDTLQHQVNLWILY